jgi:hypothetical protein
MRLDGVEIKVSLGGSQAAEARAPSLQPFSEAVVRLVPA